MRILLALRSIFFFYYDGFKNMTSLGKNLWSLVVVKAIILVIIAYFLMPNVLKQFKTEEEKVEHVSNNLLNTHIQK